MQFCCSNKAKRTKWGNGTGSLGELAKALTLIALLKLPREIGEEVDVRLQGRLIYRREENVR